MVELAAEEAATVVVNSVVVAVEAIKPHLLKTRAILAADNSTAEVNIAVVMTAVVRRMTKFHFNSPGRTLPG